MYGSRLQNTLKNRFAMSIPHYSTRYVATMCKHTNVDKGHDRLISLRLSYIGGLAVNVRMVQIFVYFACSLYIRN